MNDRRGEHLEEDRSNQQNQPHERRNDGKNPVTLVFFSSFNKCTQNGNERNRQGSACDKVIQ